MACRDREDCALDECVTCGCVPVFPGCRAVESPPLDCPELDCPPLNCCRTNRDCSIVGELCHPPDTDWVCGSCNDDNPGNCWSDEDCEVGAVCEPVPCACSDARTCVAGCQEPNCSEKSCSSPHPCPAGLICDNEPHPRCVGPVCSRDSDCAPDFDCLGRDCLRRRCASDADCDVVCVKGRCHSTLGQCNTL